MPLNNETCFFLQFVSLLYACVAFFCFGSVMISKVLTFIKQYRRVLILKGGKKTSVCAYLNCINNMNNKNQGGRGETGQTWGLLPWYSPCK